MSETPDERVDRQLAELAKVPWTCVQCGGSPDDHVIGCKVGHAEAVEKVAALEAELAKTEWQRDKAAGVAGIDISELDEAWAERTKA